MGGPKIPRLEREKIDASPTLACRDSIEEAIAAARNLGYEPLGIRQIQDNGNNGAIYLTGSDDRRAVIRGRRQSEQGDSEYELKVM
jgi:hypothetical protein